MAARNSTINFHQNNIDLCDLTHLEAYCPTEMFFYKFVSNCDNCMTATIASQLQVKINFNSIQYDIYYVSLEHTLILTVQ